MELKESTSKLSTVWAIVKKQRNAYSGGSIQRLPNENKLICLLNANIAFLNISTGEVDGTLFPEDDENRDDIMSFIVDKTGEQLFYATRNSLLYQYDLKNKCEIKHWKAHDLPIQSMDIDSTNKFLITGSADHTAKVWDIDGGFCTHNFRHTFGVVSLVRFSPTPSPFLAYTCCDDNIIRIWDLNANKSNQLVNECKSHMNTVTCLDVNEDILVSCSRDKTISLWNPKTGQLIKTYITYECLEAIQLLTPLQRISMNISTSSPYNMGIITAGERGYLRIFQCLYIKTGKEETYKIQELRHSLGDIEMYYSEEEKEEEKKTNSTSQPQLYSLKALFGSSNESEEHNVFYGVNNANTIKKYVLENGHVTYENSFIGYNDDVIDLCYIGKDINTIAVASNVNYIRLLSLPTFTSVFLFGHKAPVLSLKCTENGKYLFSASRDKTIKIWHIPTGTCIATCTGHNEAVTNICLQQNEAAISKQQLRSLFLSALKKKYTITKQDDKLKNVESEVEEIVNIPDNQLFPRFFVTCSEDKSIKYWDTNNIVDGYIDGAVKTVKGHEKSVNCVMVAPNDKLCASAGQDKLIKLWSLPDLIEIGSFTGHKRGVWDLHFSPVNNVLLSCSVDGSYRLWNVRDQICLNNVECSEASILRCGFINEGQQIVTCDALGVIRLYNTYTNELINTFEGHKDKIWTIAFPPDPHGNGFFVTGGGDGEINVWEDRSEEEKRKEVEEKEKQYQMEQQLRSCMYQKKWKPAIKLCFELNAPFALRQILESVANNRGEDIDSLFIPILHHLPVEQKQLVFSYIRDWETQSRTNIAANLLLEVALKAYDEEDIKDVPEIKDITTGIEAYMKRHYTRLNRLLQNTYVLDYCIATMNGIKTEDTTISQKRVLEDDSRGNEKKMKA
ncbi:hypothetical protein WA158_004157 [Blastocystis sp. Blastoise]